MSMRVRAGGPAVAAALVAALVSGCDSGGTDAGGGTGGSTGGSSRSGAMAGLPAALTGQKPDWRACEAPKGGEKPGSQWRCASVKVPLDYAKPGGETISIALIRQEARDKDRRIGSLLFNFGGPGASGVTAMPRMAGEYHELGARYDLVGFDPRGVARSSGVTCRDSEDQAASLERVDLTPDTPAEEAAFMKDGADFGAGCAERSGKVIAHVTTSNTARDLDLVRHVLGDEKLHYMGFSYGTQLGGTYAHLFPRNVGRTVLDAVVDPTADSAGHARNQAIGFQRALNNYFASTGEGAAAGNARVTALLKRLDREPLSTADGRTLTQSLALTGIAATLYSEETWPYLTKSLEEAETGRGGALLRLADIYNDREPDGTYGTQAHSQRAISCADSSSRPTVAEAKALLPEFRKISPVFAEFMAWDTAGWCADWPVKGEGVTPEASAPGSAPILVVGTTGDSATPYEGAKKMADELGAGVGVLLTYKGEGHGAYGSGNACVQDTVNGYLLDGKVPASGTTCS
ncbi:alpha/beta hydrolase [Streptomyces sp. WAC05374]|uniref:alpha/beta hydrolase n=1 Tax=Streptomyces sp. WAC05374 TaxID=2487420 RepID=UPI000F89A02B|nr:alpha/beta hydrolase [Streptomyces sp. WAC05374]RST09627.1 alpha/beta hydrolase [Streptomyces sp. WAC05374]TDF42920.1 alpha/beta hydrolase [Streptomyces sp. WAC05374]TDF47762.1 alpha/beta hydrolase [Streptomyces sp. WAC05374]TDF48966.1 alpha/beta hydrolase [Streptomyces sp. WAC05374]